MPGSKAGEFGRFAVAHSFGGELTYLLPDTLRPLLVPGHICQLPVRERACVGVFLGLCGQPPTFACVPARAFVPGTQPFSREALALIQWVSEYYLAPIGRCIHLLAPGFLWDMRHVDKRQKRFAKYLALGPAGAITVLKPFATGIRGEAIGLAKCKSLPARPARVALTAEQSASLEVIFSGKKSVTLLQGITGSGKTEVYLEASLRVLASGRNVMMLVPEIALTPQMSARFRAVFGEDLAVLHSGLTPVEYEREWFRAHLGQARVVLGVRSSVFCPLANVGLVIVDEEHDTSYKSDEFPCYHARDVAVKRAQIEGALCILGSATPSLESYFNASQERYAHARLGSRHTGLNLPEPTVVDARLWLKNPELQKRKSSSVRSSLLSFEAGQLLTPPVVAALKETKLNGHQSMVILNRRGFANYCLCRTCGQALRCPHCAVSTTLHKHGKAELCHYCGFTRKTLEVCPECGGVALMAMGAGTQNIESELALALPELKLGRLDRDVLTSNTRLTEVLQGFRAGEVDCLVGTQIISKGHDFPKVTLVVVLHVEDGLFLPDYRASERTFQLLTQASGRAGRGTEAGKVLLQSLIVGHPVIDFALRADVDGFLAHEIELRKLGWHPPITRQILFEFKSRDEGQALHLGNQVRDTLVQHWKNSGLGPDEVRICGPYPATLERLRDEFRFQLCISAQKKLRPAQLVPLSLLESRELARKMRCDVDPHSFL